MLCYAGNVCQKSGNESDNNNNKRGKKVTCRLSFMGPAITRTLIIMAGRAQLKSVVTTNKIIFSRKNYLQYAFLSFQ